MKKFGKKLTALLLTMIIIASSFMGLAASAQVAVTNHNPVYIVVPETIYLQPSSGQATTAQYFVNNTFNSSNNTISLDAASNATSAKVYFKCADATAVSVELNASDNRWTINTPNGSNGYWYNENVTALTTTNGSNGTKNIASLSAGGLSWLTWKFTATMKDGSTESFEAYTEIYAPYLTPVAAVGRVSSSKSNPEALSWIAGIHSVSSTYAYYSSWNMNTGNMGSDGDKGCWFVKINKNMLSPLTGVVDSSQRGSREFTNVRGFAGDYFSENSAVYYSRNASSGQIIVHSPDGILTVDTSRNKNLNTIPNLRVGFNIPYYTTGHDYLYYFSNLGANNNGGYNTLEENGNTNWCMTQGTILKGSSNWTYTAPERAFYNDTWSQSITVVTGDSSSTTKYAVKGLICGSSNRADINAVSHLAVTSVNKQNLRDAIRTAINGGYQSSWYTGDFENNYRQKIIAAAQVLGNPMATQTQINSAVTSVNNAVSWANNNMKKNNSVVASHFGVVRVLDGNGNTTSYKAASTLSANDDSKTANADQKSVLAKNNYSGYQYKGYAATTANNGLNSTVNFSSLTNQDSISFLRTLENKAYSFYYQANDIKVTVDPKGGVWNGSTAVKTFDASVGSTFTPNTPSKTGFTFNGWRITSGSASQSGNTFTFNSGNVTLTAQWTATNAVLTSDTAVIDFGLSAKIDVLSNDTVLKASGETGFVNGVYADMNGTAYSGNEGTFSVADNKIVFTPTSFLSNAFTVYTAVDVNGTTVYSELTICPASVVYYEDDFSSAITYTNGISADNSTGTWSTVGTSKTASVFQNLDDAVYGNDKIYADASNSTYSMGSSHLVSVSKKNNPNPKFSGSENNTWPCAQFIFAGTGFDVVSLISNKTGSIQVKVFKGTDTTATPFKSWLVDTYYAGKKDGDSWTVSGTAGDSLYQIPVISNSELDYGTYTVQIIPMYSTVLDHEKDGSYDFYLDAIRIYDPTGVATGKVTNNTIKDIYSQANELVAYEANIRNLLISANKINEENGVIFITPDVPSGNITDYKNAGPNNEVYLAKGQSIAFNVTADKIP